MKSTAMKPKRATLYRHDDRRPAKSYPRAAAIARGDVGSSTWVGGDLSNWTAYRRNYVICVLGDRIFWKETGMSSCTFKDGKFYGDLLSFTNVLLDIYNLDWIKTNPWTKDILLGRKDLWKGVLTGKITNPEILCKKFSKKYFGGAYSYRNLKEAFMMPSCKLRAKLWDIYYYTTNPDLMLKVMVEGYNDGNHDQYLYWDTLRLAKISNEKINPNWSVRRMQEEHQKQIERQNMREAEYYSKDSIAEPFSKDGLSLILDERTCYLEGMKMHNCVHSCYWRDIKDGNYLIARGTVNGVYVDVGITVGSHFAMLQQVHGMRNSDVQEDVNTFCIDWIARNEKELLSRVKAIRGEEPSIENTLQQIAIDDLDALDHLRRLMNRD